MFASRCFYRWNFAICNVWKSSHEKKEKKKNENTKKQMITPKGINWYSFMDYSKVPVLNLGHES